MLDCNMFPGLGRKYLETEVNLFLLPSQDTEADDGLAKAGGLCLPLLEGGWGLGGWGQHASPPCSSPNALPLPPFLEVFVEQQSKCVSVSL